MKGGSWRPKYGYDDSSLTAYVAVTLGQSEKHEEDSLKKSSHDSVDVPLLTYPILVLILANRTHWPSLPLPPRNQATRRTRLSRGPDYESCSQADEAFYTNGLFPEQPELSYW
jgi:hypothetical protein